MGSGSYGGQYPKEASKIKNDPTQGPYQLDYSLEIKNLLLETTNLIRKILERMDNAEKPSAQGGKDA